MDASHAIAFAEGAKSQYEGEEGQVHLREQDVYVLLKTMACTTL